MLQDLTSFKLYHVRLYYIVELSTSRSHTIICRLDLSRNKYPNSLTSCSAHFISIEGSSVRLGYSRNIPHSVLQCLCLGISCGFTTAETFSLWQVEQAEVSGTIRVLTKIARLSTHVNPG